MITNFHVGRSFGAPTEGCSFLHSEDDSAPGVTAPLSVKLLRPGVAAPLSVKLLSAGVTGIAEVALLSNGTDDWAGRTWISLLVRSPAIMDDGEMVRGCRCSSLERSLQSPTFALSLAMVRVVRAEVL